MQHGFTFVLFLTLAVSARAAKFTSAFLEFELPNNWSCAQNKVEWICHSSTATEMKDAIIVIAAQKRKREDTMESFMTYLKEPQTIITGGKTTLLQPRYTREITIGSQRWVDSLQGDTEIIGFYTRYLTTVKNDIAVLVTYSIVKTKYEQYNEMFDKMLQHLQTFDVRDPNAAVTPLVNAPILNSTVASAPIAPLRMVPAAPLPRSQSTVDNDDEVPHNGKIARPWLWLFAAAVGAVYYFMWKLR